jgi:hypothetical protein
MIRVYYNLHKRRLSIQEKRVNQSGRLVWKVVAHMHTIALKNPVFKVSEAGRQRVLKDKAKNVHAFIYGEMINPLSCHGSNVPVFYNPYKAPTFVDKFGNKIENANFALVQGATSGYSILVTQ